MEASEQGTEHGTENEAQEAEGSQQAEGSQEAKTGDQGQWSEQTDSAVAGVGGGDPNVPVAQSPPPPASLSGKPAVPDADTFPSGEGETAEQESTIERSPQEFGAGGS